MFVISLFLSGFFTVIVRSLAWKLKVIDRPGERKVHTVPKPRMGGLAVYLAVMLTVSLNIFIFLLELKKSLIHLPSWLVKSYVFLDKAQYQLLSIFVGATLIVILGLWDDIKGLGPFIKFSIQFLAAVIVVFSGIEITFLPSPLLNKLVTIIWIVGISNSFNLLDNMDGLSGGVAAIIFSSLFIIAIRTNQFFVASLSIVFMGAIMGFLRYNISPSSIFLGDTGSLFIGFSLATITVVTSYYNSSSMPGYWSILTPFFLMVPALFDTFSVMIIRYRNGKSLFVGDKNHLSHRLNRLGFSKRVSVLILYVFTIISSISAVLLTNVNFFGAILIFFQIIFLILLMSFFLFWKGVKLPE